MPCCSASGSIPVLALGEEPASQAIAPPGAEGIAQIPKLDPEAMTAARLSKEAELAAAEEKTGEELVVPRGFSSEKVPGALRAPGMGNLTLAEGGN